MQRAGQKWQERPAVKGEHFWGHALGGCLQVLSQEANVQCDVLTPVSKASCCLPSYLGGHCSTLNPSGERAPVSQCVPSDHLQTCTRISAHLRKLCLGPGGHLTYWGDTL